MKRIILGIVALFLFSCNEKKILDGNYILKETIAKHDPLNKWNTAKINIHIQEPRLANPHRYSTLKMDNASNSFELSRNRDEYISKHIIESNGTSTVLLDGESDIDTTLVKKYRLNPSRNIGYKNFYHFLYGIPMSLDSNIENIIKVSENTFNNVACYKLEIELKEAVISKNWNVYVNKLSMTIEGVEIIFPTKPNEGDKIYFDEFITISSIKIPRIRHWHELQGDTYSGSDLIIKEIVP